ncbi:MAG: hypothetical protein SPE43_01060 [Ruminococcus sp.]|nr:hypothetical protein [Oscillospiraceae bacterium]MDY4412953.1 hypothetical protein [Ruminococcus sp.]
MKGKLIMFFNEMYQTARNIIAGSNMSFTENDTICIAGTENRRIYAGLSSLKQINNISVFVHAEIDLCNNLVKNNDTAVTEISLFKVLSLEAVLPCNDCALKIMSLNSYNINTMILLPTQNISLSRMKEYIQSQNSFSAPYTSVSSQNTQSRYMSSDYLEKYDKDESQYLKNRLDSILNDNDDYDIDLLKEKQALQKAEQRKKFSFFKRRNDN